ncbi:MAG: hypothetical protein B6245_13245 [Desulfobacteraceae bacterium 4572_88]|nr:MAG: hypothetical protein B6245_13245 [Desulfobacteraceae bacterium 4572_88]
MHPQKNPPQYPFKKREGPLPRLGHPRRTGLNDVWDKLIKKRCSCPRLILNDMSVTFFSFFNRRFPGEKLRKVTLE